MWESIMKFLGPILASTASSAASSGINALTQPKQSQPSDPNSIRAGIQSGAFTREGLQSGAQVPGSGGAGLVPSAPPGVGGSGTSNSPTGGMNFSGGYTGGPDPRQVGGNSPAGPPSSGFTTMGYKLADQQKLKNGISGGFQGI